MCGIAGVAGAMTPAPAKVVGAMLNRLKHRGPDDEGITTAGSATIGARRLAIIDVQGGHQPMSNEDGTVIAVQNGEIYNFLELRRVLEQAGHKFDTRNDTEILPHAYEEWGTGFVERLRGMFAMALWDRREEILLLARDRFGKKPLVYTEIDGGLAFASEIQGLLAHPNVDTTVDHAAIDDYLALGYVPAPRTAFARISKLEPAHLLLFHGGHVTTHRYWQLSFEPKRPITLDAAADELRERIDEAVRIRLMSDVPLGAFLSGGLDSSTVVAYMARHTSRPVRTFAIDFRDAAFSEINHARSVARAFGTQHEEFVVDAGEADVLPLLVRHLGEPMADSSIIPTYHVSRVTRSAVTVALNGDGGDEIFGGYGHYAVAELADRTAGRLPVAAQRTAAAAARLMPRSARWPLWYRRGRKFAEVMDVGRDERYLRWVGYFVGPLHDEIIGPRLRHNGPYSQSQLVSMATRLSGAQTATERYMAADSLLALPGDLLVKMDIATMANSLEARSPLLDHELATFMATLPASFKTQSRRTKVLLRHAMRGILPESTLRRGKMGFSAPVAAWFRGPMRNLFGDVVLSQTARERGFVMPVAAERIFRDHLSGRDSRPNLLWNLLVLELWFRECVDSRPPVSQESPSVASAGT